eukprot:g29068.t1
MPWRSFGIHATNGRRCVLSSLADLAASPLEKRSIDDLIQLGKASHKERALQLHETLKVGLARCAMRPNDLELAELRHLQLIQDIEESLDEFFTNRLTLRLMISHIQALNANKTMNSDGEAMVGVVNVSTHPITILSRAYVATRFMCMRDFQTAPDLLVNGTMHDEYVQQRSRPLWRWDAVCGILLIAVAICTPFEAGFLETETLSFMGVLNIITNVFFMMDMFMQFFIAYPIETRYGPRWEYRKRLIALRYLKGWFTIDLASTLPLDFLSPGSGLGLLRTIRMLRLLKLLRLARGWRLFRSRESTEETPQIDVFDAYVMAFYTGITILVHPHAYDAINTAERLLFTILLLIGGFMWTQVISRSTAIASSLNAHQLAHQQTMDDLNNIADRLNLSRDMKIRLRKFFLRPIEGDIGFSEAWQEILNRMSPQLRRDTYREVNVHWVKKVRFFDSCSTSFLIGIAEILEIKMFGEQEHFGQLFHMYIMMGGAASRVVNFTLLLPGMVWGEDHLLLSNPDLVASNIAVSLTVVEVQELAKAGFDAVLEDFPEHVQDLRQDCLPNMLDDTMIEDWINRQDELEEGVFKRLDEVSEQIYSLYEPWLEHPGLSREGRRSGRSGSLLRPFAGSQNRKGQGIRFTSFHWFRHRHPSLFRRVRLRPAEMMQEQQDLLQQQLVPQKETPEAPLEQRSLPSSEHFGHWEERGAQQHFAYVHTHLFYIFLELVKNAARASIERAQLEERFASFFGLCLIGCASAKAGCTAALEDQKIWDHERSVKLADHGTGMNRRVLGKAFSYFYSSVKARPTIAAEVSDFDRRMPLAGFGFGLPISRVMARYFAGNIDVNSIPGQGTDVYVYL